MRKQAIIAASVLILFVTGGAYAKRQDIRHAVERYQRGPIPPETARENIIVPEAAVDEFAAETEDVGTTETTPQPEPIAVKPFTPPEPRLESLPAQMNLKVPFFPQAPFKVWDPLHEDACEEASALMLQAYANGETNVSLKEIDRRILELANYQLEKYGSWKDSDAATTAEYMRDKLGLSGTKVLTVKVADDIRKHIAVGRPVIIPAAGKLLMNPNFRNGGPLYHMLVLKGYRSDGAFIANDPGTRLGENFVYSEATIMAALHDFNGGDVELGAQLIIVIE